MFVKERKYDNQSEGSIPRKYDSKKCQNHQEPISKQMKKKQLDYQMFKIIMKHWEKHQLQQYSAGLDEDEQKFTETSKRGLFYVEILKKLLFKWMIKEEKQDASINQMNLTKEQKE